MAQHLTLDEIARRAGVSRTTASRVLNQRPNVREDVRNRVLSVIAETGYQPHHVARSLAAQRSQIIGLVLPRRADTLFTDSYFPRLIQGIAQACNQRDYTLTLFLLQSAEDERKLYPRIAAKGLLDGLIVQVGETGDQWIAHLAECSLPLVIAGRPVDTQHFSYVDVDNVTGAYQATLHLIQRGYKRIGTITGALNTTAALDRLTGYRRALQERGHTPEEALIVEGDFTETGGYYAMQRLLPQHPDALFVASDTMALGALRALREAGLRVPDDVALVGFDDLPPAMQANPPLTTIRQPVLGFGAKAVEMLLDIVENGPEPPRRVVFGVELVVRKSCGAV
ncbi:MAG: LacI family DNA-binding transcriptional regulator [Anaerolineae bacterium]|nr:LacI family DNA-binding transcriptional regulator [Anaerolineae bacterium]